MPGRPISLADDRDPWDRQPGETIKQYARFRTFRDLGPEARSLKQVAEILTATGDKTLTHRTMQQLAYQFHWTYRAEAHDVEVSKAARAQLAKVRQEAIDRQRKLGLALQGKGAEALRQTPAAALAPVDIVRMITQGSQLIERALGEPARVEVSGPAGAPVEVADVTGYTPEQRRIRMAQLQVEVARRLGLTGEDDAADDRVV